MSDLVLHLDTPRLAPMLAPLEDAPDSDLFRRGRLGMGWSPAALAQTILVEEQTILEWERGSRPIPRPVLSWVAMYTRNAPEPAVDEMPQDLAA